MSNLKALQQHFPHKGKIEWIGIRSEKKAVLIEKESIDVNTEIGIVGDHYSGSTGKRHVTIMQAEIFPVLTSLSEKTEVTPYDTRRNILISGFNLTSTIGHQLKIGDAILEVTGPCHPCSRMEENLGNGGYNIMRGWGGITARVIHNGSIHKGAAVEVIAVQEK